MAPWLDPFLTALRTTGNVAQSARAAGTHTSTVYDLRRKDADFAAAWDNALEDATDALEAEARRRALDGVNEPVVYQGQLTPLFEYDEQGKIAMEEYDTGLKKDGEPVLSSRPKQLVIDGKPQFLTLNKRSDALLMFLLKGLRKKYGTESHEITGKDGAPLATIDETKRAARIAALLELAKNRKGNVDDLA
jgi:hypothetical protein